MSVFALMMSVLEVPEAPAFPADICAARRVDGVAEAILVPFVHQKGVENVAGSRRRSILVQARPS